MHIADSPIPEFEQEMSTTRRLLERVPGGQGAWKPHAKSFSLGHLAQLVARMPGWVAQTLRHERRELTEFPGYSLETTETLLAEFDRNVADARAALAEATAVGLSVPWSLTRGGEVLLTMPRGAMIRGHLNHLIHHRGQLSVYLRLVDVPLPPIYGPTADERM